MEIVLAGILSTTKVPRYIPNLGDVTEIVHHRLALFLGLRGIRTL
jgi:hypothetical protein